MDRLGINKHKSKTIDRLSFTYQQTKTICTYETNTNANHSHLDLLYGNTVGFLPKGLL